jgi:hypothetical protein
MSWDAIGAIGQMLGSVAVLVTLGYLAMQLRQADRNQRALMNQGVINRGSEEDIAFLAQPHVIEVTSRVLAGETEFTAIEVNQLRLVMRKIILGAQDPYVQHTAALADQVTFDNANPFRLRYPTIKLHSSTPSLRRSAVDERFQPNRMGASQSA